MNFATLRDAGPLFYREKTKQLLNFCIDLEKKKKHLKNNSNTRNRKKTTRTTATNNQQPTQNHERAENVNVALVFRVFGLCTSWWWDSLCWNATYSNYKVGPLLAIHEVVTSLIGGITLVTPTEIWGLIQAQLTTILPLPDKSFVTSLGWWVKTCSELKGWTDGSSPGDSAELLQSLDLNFEGIFGGEESLTKKPTIFWETTKRLIHHLGYIGFM